MKIPVLIVGAGPVGLATAVFLAHWGVDALVIDKRDPTAAPPRAGASVRTLEILRSVGLTDAGWIAGSAMHTVFRTSAFGETLHETALPEAYDKRIRDCGPVDSRTSLTQLEVQKMALARLENVRLHTRLVDFTMSDNDIVARLDDGGEIRCDYLIGADGANSDVRQRLGIDVPDREVVAQMNTAFYRADLGGIMDEWRTHACVVRNDAVYATVFSKNGRDQWSSHIMDYPGKPAGLTELSPERTVELLHAAIGKPVPIELHAVNAWEAAIGMATNFRRGRAFLVGDAAHVQSSAGGLGMNTGIQDGHNLAWKIAAVLTGQAGVSLLDTYEPERRSAVRQSLALSQAMHRGYQNLAGDPAQMWEKVAADYLHAMMFYGYRSSAIVGDVPEVDVLSDEVRTGYRVPHRWLAPGLSTVDITDWTLLGDASWTSTDVRFFDVGWSPAALVRPDGFVGWQGHDPAELPSALATLRHRGVK